MAEKAKYCPTEKRIKQAGKDQITSKGIVIFCGNYGSGKTEIALNFAVKRKLDGVDVKIADLDLVNPYFRTREMKNEFEKLGIDVVLPDKKYMHADLPILAPAVAGLIQQPSELAIFDAGGDDVGVTVLAALENHLAKKQVRMLQVINPFRPFTEDIHGCIRIKEEIERSSKIAITGLVGNANLMDDTRLDHIYEGYELLKDVSESTGLEIEFITAGSYLMHQLEMDRFSCPILEITRQLNPPWKLF